MACNTFGNILPAVAEVWYLNSCHIKMYGEIEIYNSLRSRIHPSYARRVMELDTSNLIAKSKLRIAIEGWKMWKVYEVNDLTNPDKPPIFVKIEDIVPLGIPFLG